MKKMKKVLAVALSLVMAGSLAACGSSSTETKASETAGAAETAAESTAESTAESGSEAASEVSTDGKVYNIGICQLIQHDALDAATKGFEDAQFRLFFEAHRLFRSAGTPGCSSKRGGADSQPQITQPLLAEWPAG